jgi:hypothetical protein
MTNVIKLMSRVAILRPRRKREPAFFMTSTEKHQSAIPSQIGTTGKKSSSSLASLGRQCKPAPLAPTPSAAHRYRGLRTTRRPTASARWQQRDKDSQ